MRLIYKICPEPLWREAEKTGAFAGSPRGGDLFPHVYGPLPLAAVRWVKPLPLGPDGQHVFPELAP